MYPDWPDSAADLVPLPRCNGPKIKPFDFQGPQKIEFLEHIGEGVHAHVFKVKIKGQVYALKLVSETKYTNALKIHEPKLFYSSDLSTTMNGMVLEKKLIGRTAKP